MVGIQMISHFLESLQVVEVFCWIWCHQLPEVCFTRQLDRVVGYMTRGKVVIFIFLHHIFKYGWEPVLNHCKFIIFNYLANWHLLINTRNQLPEDGQLRRVVYDLAEALECPVDSDEKVKVFLSLCKYLPYMFKLKDLVNIFRVKNLFLWLIKKS